MANPDFTISDVLEWARTKPADKRYDYDSPSECAICQFLMDTGRASKPNVALRGEWRDQFSAVSGKAPKALNHAVSRLQTFGALVTRLEALLPAVSETWTRADAYLTDRVEA